MGISAPLSLGSLQSIFTPPQRAQKKRARKGKSDLISSFVSYRAGSRLFVGVLARPCGLRHHPPLPCWCRHPDYGNKYIHTYIATSQGECHPIRGSSPIPGRGDLPTGDSFLKLCLRVYRARPVHPGRKRSRVAVHPNGQASTPPHWRAFSSFHHTTQGYGFYHQA